MAGHLDGSVWCGLVSQISASPGIEKEIVNLILLTSSRFHENTILISGEIKKLANNFIERRRDALKFKSLCLLVKTKVWVLFPEIKREKKATKGGESRWIYDAPFKTLYLGLWNETRGGLDSGEKFLGEILNAPRSGSNFLGNAPLIRSAAIRDDTRLAWEISLGKFSRDEAVNDPNSADYRCKLLIESPPFLRSIFN